ncbi:MAG: hypothetical protein K0R18_1982, partial [Bacillales bacterium]|nr:hypothetical protein [Bacillales bacterium]
MGTSPMGMGSMGNTPLIQGGMPMGSGAIPM